MEYLHHELAASFLIEKSFTSKMGHTTGDKLHQQWEGHHPMVFIFAVNVISKTKQNWPNFWLSCESRMQNLLLPGAPMSYQLPT